MVIDVQWAFYIFFIFLKVSSLITYDYDDFLRYLLAHHISLVFSSNKKVRGSGILLVGIIWSDRSQIQGNGGKLQFSPGRFWGDFGTWSSLDQWLKSQWLSPSWEVLQMFLLGLCMLWKITFESFISGLPCFSKVGVNGTQILPDLDFTHLLEVMWIFLLAYPVILGQSEDRLSINFSIWDFHIFAWKAFGLQSQAHLFHTVVLHSSTFS